MEDVLLKIKLELTDDPAEADVTFRCRIEDASEEIAKEIVARIDEAIKLAVL